MKVLVTGATGFVGSHTVAAVRAAGHHVRLFVRSPKRIEAALAPHGVSASDFEVAEGDVNDIASVQRALEGCDSLIHAGSAYAFGLPFWKARSMMTTNVRGTATVLTEAHAAGLDPMVYVSSSFALMQNRPTVLTEETSVGSPPETYPRSKARAERLARDMQEAGAPVVISYPGGVWGPHDPHFGETALMVSKILSGGLPFVFGGTIPLSDVREVARVHMAVLESGLGPRRYLVPSHSPRLADVVKLIASITGRDLPTKVVPVWPALAIMRIGAWAQTVSPIRLPVEYSGPWMLSRNNSYGQSRAESDFGIRARPLEDTVRDTLSWMAQTGRLAPDLLGALSTG